MSKNSYYVYEDGRIIEKVESKKQVRVRRFSCVSYLAVDDLLRFLKSAPWIQHWAYCVHDRDLWTVADENHNPEHIAGTLKEKHIHVLLYTYDGKTSSAVSRLFNRYSAQVCSIGEKPENTFAEICDDMLYCWRYLLHLDDPDKYPYEHHCRHCDDYDYWNSFERTGGLNDSASNTASQIIEDLLSGVSEREMVVRYGKEYVYHRTHFHNSKNAIINQTYGGSYETVPIDTSIVRLLLDSQSYNETEIAIFLDTLALLNRECIRQYGSRADFLIGDYTQNVKT